jgi:predicted RNase H-like HicB family nuclease
VRVRSEHVIRSDEKNSIDGYEVVLVYDKDEYCFVASIPELVGCAVDRPTQELAIKRLRVAKRAWVKDARSTGHPIPPPRHSRANLKP